MAYAVSSLAIKDAPSDQIIDTVSDYYKTHNLALFEERIGDRTGKYANPKNGTKI